MKKWILFLVAFLAMGFFDLWPFPQEDAGSLFIVETLLVAADGETVSLTAGDRTGEGETMDEALNALREKMPGQLFLRQVRRVFFCGEALRSCPPETLPEELPMSALVYHASEVPEIEELEPVLDAREARGRGLPTLAQLINDRLLGKPAKLTELEAEYADP